ncbi:glycosyltransferase [Sulfurimonas sp.]|uniref:glycosyltransferase n=1 Tax=Sulfurimonas sp. TaxID=2022749 RepID=UPI002B473328|nr:glycosyltransferase [Sulfurimonas sp.]
MSNENKKKKLLYITDQHEYTDHGSISALFNGYLKEYLDVHVVYLTKYKNSFQKKGTDYIVPQQYTKNICDYLESKDIELNSFSYVFVRNMLDVLSDTLKNRSKFGFKLGYRASFPKTEEALAANKEKNKASLLKTVGGYFEKFNKQRLLSECDLFMPTSKDMEEVFYADSGVRSYPLPAGLCPNRITSHRISDGADRNFIYVGTLDGLRNFAQVLVAFSRVKSQEWHLNISTFNPKYAQTVLNNYPSLVGKVTVREAGNLDELLVQVDDCDIGIALLPDISVYNTVIPAKVMDYYTCAIPTILTDNPKNRTILSDEDALFCSFEVDSITATIEKSIAMSEGEIADMGHSGQAKLLKHKRNYEIMAKELFEELESL